MDDTLIPFAICSDGEYLYANELIEKHRELYHRNQLSIICPECGLELQIVPSKNNGYFFRHFPNQSCALDSKKFTIEYRNYILQQSHESEKHQFLKNNLKEKLALSDDPLIDKNSVCIEKYIDGRRADVYCERNGKKIAFEVQVSPISLSIILARINHYREKNIHLFWVIEPSEFDKPQFQKDIKHYGLSEHIYELSSDEKLLTCHFQAPKIAYKNGALHVIESNGKINIDLSHLKYINNQTQLLDYYEEENYFRTLLSSIQKAAMQRDLKALNNLYLSKNKSFFENNHTIINSYLNWLIKDPSLIYNDISYAAYSVDFVPYIETFHEEWWQSKDDLTCIDSSFSCPKCEMVKNNSCGTVDYHTHKFTCEHCNYSEKDLIQYLADIAYGGNIHYGGNTYDAKKEICFNLTIPYKS